MVRWILTRNVDINRGACSLPLHIACLRGLVAHFLAEKYFAYELFI